MLTIHKYELQLIEQQLVMLPEGFTFLDIQLQGHSGWDCSFQMWAMVDTEKPKSARTVRIYGTGHPIEAFRLTYLATIQVRGFVWHFFLDPK